MRVLHVIDELGAGGAELLLIHLIERLQKQGVQNTVLSPTTAGIPKNQVIASGARLV